MGNRAKAPRPEADNSAGSKKTGFPHGAGEMNRPLGAGGRGLVGVAAQ